MKNKWIWYAIPIAIGGYIIYKKFKPSVKKDDETKVDTSVSEIPPSSGNTGLGKCFKKDDFPLKKGSQGVNVKAVQTLLKKIDRTTLPKFGVDCDFGSETEAAVMKILGSSDVGREDYAKLVYMAKK